MRRNVLDGADLSRARAKLLSMHYEAGVGHIGGNLSSIDILLLLFHEYLSNDDELILSKGHSAGALYIALWTLGILTDDDLKTFHKDATKLPGHPPANTLPKVSFATGSLGHGLSLAAGTALAFKLKGESRRVFCVMSDGEWQEGSTWEALIFACHHRLDNLTILVDENRLQGYGATPEIASMAPLMEKLRGFDIDVEQAPGHDLLSMRQALDRTSQFPRLIALQTNKGRGVDFMEDRMEWHYLPLTKSQYESAVEGLSRV